MRTGIRLKETPSIIEIERILDEKYKDVFALSVRQLMDLYKVSRGTVISWYTKPTENPMLKHSKLPGSTTKGIRFPKFCILNFHSKYMMGNE